MPGWLRDAVIYQVFVDRFAPGAMRDWLRPPALDRIWGGTIRGVAEKLEYIRDLGATCIWLSPVFASPIHHGYDPSDYLAVKLRLGTDQDLTDHFAAAHAAGLRVILDFVASHMSDEHSAFRSARAESESCERTWFAFRDDGSYRSFFDVPSMPQIRGDEPGARSFLIDAATHWLRAGADGFRLDSAQGQSHAFWAAFRQATRAIQPDAVTLGDVVETASLQRSNAGRLDGTLDLLLLQQLRAFFGFATSTPASIDTVLSRHLAYSATN